MNWNLSDRVRGRTLFFVLGALALFALAAGGVYWGLAVENSSRPAPPSVTTIERGESGLEVPPPPFRIKGTLLSAAGRAAVISVLDHNGREYPEKKVAEGETIEGYQLTRIDTYRVYFEKAGARFMLVVGGDRPETPPVLPADATFPATRRTENMQIVPLPPGFDAEKARRDMEELAERMRQDPMVREGKERWKREMEQRQSAPAAAKPVPP